MSIAAERESEEVFLFIIHGYFLYNSLKRSRVLKLSDYLLILFTCRDSRQICDRFMRLIMEEIDRKVSTKMSQFHIYIVVVIMKF